jgi:hypothetical protein
MHIVHVYILYHAMHVYICMHTISIRSVIVFMCGIRVSYVYVCTYALCIHVYTYICIV